MTTLYDESGILAKGFLKIYNDETNELLQDRKNAIHYENMSIALAQSLSNSGKGFIYQMAFGNGGTIIDPTGVIMYLTPNTTGTNSGLYNETYVKVVDGNSVENTDPTRNNVTVRHVVGTNFTDILVTCLLDYGEPADQLAFDNATNTETPYLFDEIGLKSYDPDGTPRLLTHVIFHPELKSLNKRLRFEYTVRIQSLSGLLGA